MISLICIPFNIILILMTLQVRNYFCTAGYEDAKIDSDAKERDIFCNSEFCGILNKKKKRALIFRAARLAKMQDTMDNVSVEQEMSTLQGTLMDEQIATCEEESKDPFWYIPNFIRKFYKHAHHLDASVPDKLLYAKIDTARRKAEKMMQQMKHLPSDASREHFLLRQFTITFLGEGRQGIASRFLQHPEEITLTGSLIAYACLAFLPVWFAMELFYIFLMGIRMGSGTTVPWLIGCLTSFVQQMIFLQPMKIWMKWTVLSRACCEDVTFMHQSEYYTSHLCTHKSHKVSTIY